MEKRNNNSKLLTSPKKRKEKLTSSLSIELLPEYGWDLGNDRRTFGPATLFEGNVVIKSNELTRMTKSLCLSFYAIESMLACDIGPVGRRTQESQLFNIQKTLWEDKVLEPNKVYRFPFIVQMPFVQFPPSMSNDYYHCSFFLVAHLNSKSDKYANMVAKVPIEYRPLIETKALKQPICLSDSSNRKKVTMSSDMLDSGPTVQLYSLDYVSGDTIRASIDFRDKENEYSVTINLYQIFTFTMENTSKIETLVTTNTISVTPNRSNIVCLKTFNDLPPSFNFSRMIAITYKLQIILQKASSKKNGALFKKLVTPAWFNTLANFETEIVFGNLGHGIRSNETLNPYSVYNRTTRPLPLPKFIEKEEHEDALPLYDSTKLPLYYEAIHGAV